jgi:GNAT superfamily N-acetyltransferase
MCRRPSCGSSSTPKLVLVDIALLPEHRNAGIGTRLIRRLMDEAALAGKPVRPHVTPCGATSGWASR